MPVPASLLLPEKQLPHKPAIVALHDHGGFYYCGKDKLLENPSEPECLTVFRKQLYDGYAYAAELARAGCAVLAIDAFYFGGRRLMPETLPAQKTAALNGLTSGSTAYINAYNQLAGCALEWFGRTLS